MIKDFFGHIDYCVHDDTINTWLALTNSDPKKCVTDKLANANDGGIDESTIPVCPKKCSVISGGEFTVCAKLLWNG